MTISKTLWANLSDEELLELLGGEDGVFKTVEELFAAKEIEIKKKKVEKKELITVLDSKLHKTLMLPLVVIKILHLKKFIKRSSKWMNFFVQRIF